MNKIIQKMTLSMLTALLILLTFGASTFAWISMITTVRAEGMMFEVNTPATLLISKTGLEGSFTDTITFELETPKNIHPSSSINGEDDTFFAIDDLEAIDDLGRIIEGRTNIVAADDEENPLAYTATGEAFANSDAYYQKDFYLQLTAVENAVKAVISEMKLEYTGTDAGEKTGVNSFRFAVLLEHEAVEDDPETDENEAQAAYWESLGVASMRTLTADDKAYTETSKAGYSKLDLVEITADNKANYKDSENQEFEVGALVIEVSDGVYRTVSNSEYSVVNAGDKYYDYDSQTEKEVSVNTYITKESTGIVYLKDSIELIPEYATVLEALAGKTEQVHVMVRLWLDGEDVNTNNAYFAKLTDAYVFSITFRLENIN